MRSCVHYTTWSASHSCLLKLICDPPASCFWHMAPYSKEARPLPWIWETREDGFFSSSSLVPSPPCHTVCQMGKDGKRWWKSSVNCLTCPSKSSYMWLWLAEGDRALYPSLLIHGFVLCYYRLCYKYRFFCSATLHIIVFKNNVFTWKMQFWGADSESLHKSGWVVWKKKKRR